MRPAVALLLVATVGGCADPAPDLVAIDGHPPLGWVAVQLEGATTVGSDGPFVVVDAIGRERARGPSLPAGAVTLEDGLVHVGGQPLGAPPVELLPEAGATLSAEGRHYRGSLRIDADDGAPRVVNRLPVDEYLRGVLPAEMPDRFGFAALKAQAVAARSYALHEVGERGWLHADVRSQAYGGLDAETYATGRAVEETAGQVLTTAGRVVPAWFHSTCGGATVPAQTVFGFPPEGVMEHDVACPDCRHSPTWSWRRTVSGARVCAAAGLPPSPLVSVTAEPARYPARPARVTVRAGERTASVPADTFRARLSSGRPWDEQLLSTRWAAAPRIVGGSLVVDGRGWGHGVGLCQYGAAGYAERGAGYRAILQRYYPGAQLVRLR